MKGDWELSTCPCSWPLPLTAWLTSQEEAGPASAGSWGTCRSCERQMRLPWEDQAEAPEWGWGPHARRGEDKRCLRSPGQKAKELWQGKICSSLWPPPLSSILSSQVTSFGVCFRSWQNGNRSMRKPTPSSRHLRRRPALWAPSCSRWRMPTRSPWIS